MQTYNYFAPHTGVVRRVVGRKKADIQRETDERRSIRGKSEIQKEEERDEKDRRKELSFRG
jgi:hypothetical protein